MKHTNFLKRTLLGLLLIPALCINAQDAPSSYYKTNPTFGQKVTTAITIDGNPAEWTKDMLIAQGAANDDARAFKGPHEYPIYDLYQLYAAWDNTNLYLLWQMTNVTDIVCPEQNGVATGEARPTNADIPFEIAFDIDPATGTDGLLSGKTAVGEKGTHVWDVFNYFPNKNVDKLLMFSAKPGVGSPGVFSINPTSGSFDYTNVKLFNQVGVDYKIGNYSVPTQIFGVNKYEYTGYVASDLSVESNYVDFNAKGHNKLLDYTYEMAIPLTALGIDASYLENTGVGVMLISTYGQSGINSLPYDSATYNNVSLPYTQDKSSSKEKEDADGFTFPFARIGAGSGPVVAKPVLTVSPKGGTYIGGTSVTLSATGDKTPIKIYYTLDGTTPSATSTAYTDGNPISITVNKTTLKAVAIDADGVSSYVATNVYKTEEDPIIIPTGITVSFKKPTDWGTAGVSIWAWTGTATNLFTTWPGVAMTEKTDGWYSYTFADAVTNVNVIFSKAGAPQTVDITNITTSTCYEQDALSAGKITVKTATCPTTSVESPNVSQRVTIYPNPANDFVSIETQSVSSQVIISTLEGIVVKTVNNYKNNERIDLSNISDGIFILKIIQENGAISTSKLIKR